jgi:hypothetical protein
VKLPEALTVEGCPKVCNTDLSSFEEPDAFSVLVLHHIIEAREVCCQYVDQSRCRMLGGFYASSKT